MLLTNITAVPCGPALSRTSAREPQVPTIVAVGLLPHSAHTTLWPEMPKRTGGARKQIVLRAKPSPCARPAEVGVDTQRNATGRVTPYVVRFALLNDTRQPRRCAAVQCRGCLRPYGP